MPQDDLSTRGRGTTLTPGDTQRLRLIRERLKRLERELAAIKRSASSR